MILDSHLLASHNTLNWFQSDLNSLNKMFLLNKIITSILFNAINVDDFFITYNIPFALFSLLARFWLCSCLFFPDSTSSKLRLWAREIFYPRFWIKLGKKRRHHPITGPGSRNPYKPDPLKTGPWINRTPLKAHRPPFIPNFWNIYIYVKLRR